ncbi:MAG TPA: BrnA antitoxin family protein [Stellaceae bacterium]|nr:BrnA antitoxin family protein [Stellaceae bacterium]
MTLRLDGDVLDAFKSGGPGWQTRINEALRKHIG